MPDKSAKQSQYPNLTPKRVSPNKGKITAYRQALMIQKVMFDMAISEKTESVEKVSAAKAWVVLEEQKRILKNRPLPGSFKPITPKSKSKDSIDSEPIE